MAYPTRVRYGLRLLTRLALQDESGRLSMSEIAQEEGVSIKYLEQIVSLLKPLGILESVRGARGGYSLTGDPARITMDKVFASLGGLDDPVPCLDDPTACGRTDVCTTLPFWRDLEQNRRKYLQGVTLADIVAAAPKGGVEFRESARFGIKDTCGK